MGILSLIMQADKAMRELNREATTHNLSIDELRKLFRVADDPDEIEKHVRYLTTRSASARLPVP